MSVWLAASVPDRSEWDYLGRTENRGATEAHALDVERIVGLYLDGASYRRIAEKLGCSKNTSMRHVNAYFVEGKERTDQVEREQKRVLARLTTC